MEKSGDETGKRKKKKENRKKKKKRGGKDEEGVMSNLKGGRLKIKTIGTDAS